MLACLFLLAMALNADATLPSEPPPANVVHASQAQQTDAQQIATLLSQQYAAWDARDLEGYLAVFWRSPLLVYIVQQSIWMGWDDVHAHLEREYPDKNAMGHPVLERLQTNLVDAGTATTVEWWTAYFPGSK